MATEKAPAGNMATSSDRAPDRTPAASNKPFSSSTQKSYEMFSCTIRDPPYAYAHLQLDSHPSCGGVQGDPLDALQARSYCASAMQQFLGVTGAAVTVDVLKVEGRAFWVRVPRQDLGRFSAAIAAWPGVGVGTAAAAALRILACGDWLGSLIGRSEQQKLWHS